MACIQEHWLGLPHFLPSACLHTAGQGLLPCPCTATIGEEAGNAPSGVSSAWYSNCTSFEKSSLLSSPVPRPDTRHGLFERQPRHLEAELFISQHRSEGDSYSFQQTLNKTSHFLALDPMAVSRGSCVKSRMANTLDTWARSRSIIPSATPYDTTAHTVRPYRSDYAQWRAAIDWISGAPAVK